MTNARPPSQPVRLISDLETLRLLTQPVRLRIVEALRAAPGPLAVKELAIALGTSQTKLYYHVNLLEAADLIRVVATRVVSGITEKRYEAATYRIGVDRALLAPGTSGNAGLEVLLSVILDQVRTDIRRSVAAGLIDLDLATSDQVLGPRQLVLGRKWFWMTEADVAALNTGLNELWGRFTVEDLAPDAALSNPAKRQSGAALFELLLGFYPTAGPIVTDPLGGGDGDLERESSR